MRILVIISRYPPHHLGGAELRCRDGVENLQSRGHEVRVLVSTYNVNGKRRDRHVWRVLHLEPSMNLWQRIIWDIQDLTRIKQHINNFQPDIIHLVSMRSLARTIFPFLAKQSVPIVYDEGGIGLIRVWNGHGRWISFCEGKTENPCKKAVKTCFIMFISSFSLLPVEWAWPENMRVYFNSQAGLKMAQKAGIPVENAKVIYSGIDLGRFYYRERLELDPEIRIIIPGRIHPIKGVQDAISVMSILVKRNFNNKIFLDILGPIDDQEYYRSLKRQIKDLSLEEIVSFSGFLNSNDMASQYRSADICFFPSQHVEGFSRVPIEAMASGTVVITSGNEGSKEIISNGVNGFIVPFVNLEAVADVVERLVENRELYKKIISRARRDVEEKFALERAVKQIERVLTEAIQVA